MAGWLDAAGLGGLVDVFEAEDITPDMLGDLEDADLRELGLTLGQRKRFQAAKASGLPGGFDATAPTTEQRGERRQLTVVFVDLVGSTDLSRRLDPEDMSELLRRYQDAVSGTVARMGGHVDKFLGDGVVAFFGWPLAREDAVEQAVRASLAIVGQVAALEAPQNEKLGCRVGIATGLVVVQPDGQVMGETPNLAARLQSIGEPGAVVVSGTTADMTRGMFAVEEIERPSLKGFPDGTEAYQVTDARLGVSRFEARGQRDLSPIIGRESELATLAKYWEAAKAGNGAAVRIEGEAGIGKSRLLAGLRSMFPTGDRFQASYQCSPHFSDVPLWPVSESLQQIYEFAGPAGPEEHKARLQARLERIGNDTPDGASLMAQLIGVDIGPDPAIDALDARTRRRLTLELLVRQAECISSIRPLQIVLEDAHWADRTTLEYIEQLIAKVAHLPVLVVITTRGTDGLHDADWSAKIQLERLGKTESREMISGLLSDATGAADNTVSSAFLDDLIARGEGIPLFLEELTRGLLLAQSGEPEAGRADVPATLHDLLMARLDRLGSAKGVAQSASCIGREFSVDLLSEILGQSAASLSAPLADLTEAGILIPAPVHNKADFAFYHALIRDAAYESLLFRDRQALHASVLVALDKQTDVRPELVAQHAEAAGDMERAGRELLHAGKQAAERWANKEAEQLLTRAVDVISGWPPGEDRLMAEIECRLTLGDALGAVRGYASHLVEQNYDAVRELCETAGRTDLLFQALRGLWNGIYNTGAFAKSLPVAERMRDLAEKTGELRYWVTAQRSIGSNYLSLNFFQEASEAYRDCIQRGAELPDGAAATSYGELPIAFAHGMLAQLEAFACRLDSAISLARRGEEIARANGHPLAINQALAIVGIIHWLRREPEEALAAAEEEGRLASEYGYVHWKAHSDVMAGACHARLGKPHSGLTQLAGGIDAWIGNGARSYAPVYFCYLADCAVDAGRPEIARTAVADGLKLAHSSGEFFALAELKRLKAKLEAPKDALALLKDAITTAEDQGAILYQLRSLSDVLELPASATGAFRERARDQLEAVLVKVDEHAGGIELCRARKLVGQTFH